MKTSSLQNVEKSYWDNRYAQGGDSGYGSYGEQLEKKLNWIFSLDFHSITEVGCGDMNFASSLMKMNPVDNYTGYDVSRVIVERNTLLYPQYDFRVVSDAEFVKSDLVMCVDVLFHIIKDEDCESLLQKLEQTWTKYLVITAYERDEEFTNHVRIRKFDYKRFGEPLVREIVEEDGTLYFYIFER